MWLPCIRMFQVKERTKKNPKLLLAVNMGAPVSDPYNGNGLSSGSLFTVMRQVIVATSK